MSSLLKDDMEKKARRRAEQKAKKKNKSRSNGAPLPPPPLPATGRIVGHYVLKLESRELNNLNVNWPLEKIWAPIEVSPESADFFALGCRHPGEVRFISASLNVEHLRPITLTSTPTGSEVEVLFDDASKLKPEGM